MALGFGKPKVVATTNEDNIPENRCARPACGKRVTAGQKRRNFGTCGSRKCLAHVQAEALRDGDVDGHDANAGRTVKSKDGKTKYKVVSSRRSGGTEILKLAPIGKNGRPTSERVTKRVTDVEEL
jgi:hypothetical protein